jgi:hypothetical protein
MELSWSEWVINYDFAHQVVMAQSIQHTSRNWSESAQAWFTRMQRNAKAQLAAWQRRHGAWGLLVPLAVALVLIALRNHLLGAAIRKFRLYWNLRDAATVRVNPQMASRLYSDLLRLLARRGWKRSFSQTPLEFAGTVQTPALAPAVHEFTQVYAHARFGGAPCDIRRLHHLLEQIRSSLRSPSV